jgi:hypothetical protein
MDIGKRQRSRWGKHFNVSKVEELPIAADRRWSASRFAGFSEFSADRTFSI